MSNGEEIVHVSFLKEICPTEMTSTTGTAQCIKMTDPPTRLQVGICLVITNMLQQTEIAKEQQLEMANILHEFVVVNYRFFSEPVLSAAKVLLEEIKKTETS